MRLGPSASYWWVLSRLRSAWRAGTERVHGHSHRRLMRPQLNVELTTSSPPQEFGECQLNSGRITKPMLDTDDLALWYALNRLMTNYWTDVDSNCGAQAHEFYLPNALYAVGNNRFEGEQKIRAFYARRRQRGRTTTRHLVDNLRVFRDDARHARAVGVMSLYRADGNPPFQGARPPAMIADFEAQCVLGDDRLWRFQSHVLRPIFRRQRRPDFVDDRPETSLSVTRSGGQEILL